MGKADGGATAHPHCGVLRNGIHRGKEAETLNEVTRMQYGDKEIILVATAHVSSQSVEQVRNTISEEQPDSICIELDEQRYRNIKNPKAWESTDLVKVIKSKRVGFMMANLALSSYQRKMAKKLGTEVGGEMIQGMKSAEETGAHLVLADRSIQTTFLRIWRKLTLWEKCKLVFGLLFAFDEDQEVSEEEFKNMLQEDFLESALSDIRKSQPKIGQILISERDQHLAAKIREAPGKKVVAVLGGAHVPGVKEELYKEQDLEEITQVPPPKPYTKVVGWIIPAIILCLIIYSFAVNLQTGLQQISVWVLWNSGLAALFALLALAHPLSILTALVVAPISSLNPFFACGWFAGLVEASVKKPTVQDVNNIPTDIFSFKGFFTNRFLKIVLVVFMANLGSTIGTFVAGMDIITNLI